MTLITLLWGLVALGAAAAAGSKRSILPLPIAAAGVFAAIAMVLGAGFFASCFVFVTVTLIGRWAVRPVQRASAATEPRVRPGLGSIVGMPAIVVERISNDEAVGCVRVAEELWSARLPEGASAIDVGARVHVVEVRGSTAIVSS